MTSYFSVVHYEAGDLIRVVTVASEFPLEFSVDEHDIIVHEMDAFQVTKTIGHALIMNPGETALVSLRRRNNKGISDQVTLILHLYAIKHLITREDDKKLSLLYP